jgi:hypothetical protein
MVGADPNGNRLGVINLTGTLESEHYLVTPGR